MDWEIYHENGNRSTFKGTREEVVKHLEFLYPDFHVEAYTDQVLVWSSTDVVDNLNVDPVASAIPL